MTDVLLDVVPNGPSSAMTKVLLDALVEEDRGLLHANKHEPISLPDGMTQIPRHATARDVFAIFQDLCLLGNAPAVPCLSIVFARSQHSELLLLLRHHPSSLLLKTMSERSTSSFPLTIVALASSFSFSNRFLPHSRRNLRLDPGGLVTLEL